MKAFDTVNHDMMLNIIERFGAPPKLRPSITRIYWDLKIVLNIGKVEEKMVHILGLRQVEYMAPVLFLSMVISSAETLDN